MARRRLAQGDPVGAWAVLRDLAEAGPAGGDVPRFAFKLGRQLMKVGEVDHAKAAYGLAYETGGAQVSGAAAAAFAAFNLGLLAEATEPPVAEAWYRRAMQFENGGDAVAGSAASLGLMRYKAGDVERARALFQQALDAAGDRTAMRIANAIGEALGRLGAVADAEPMMRYAIEAGHLDARLSLARMLIADGRLEQAEQLLREAVDGLGDMAALVALGDLLVQRVDPGADLAHLFTHANPAAFADGYAGHLPDRPEITEAEQCYREAVAAGELTAPARLGHLLMGTGRAAEAETVLRQAVQDGANDAEALLAALLHLRGDDEEAARVLEHAVAADNLRALVVMADLEGHHEDRHAQAADLLRRALRVGGAPLGAGGMLFVHLAFLEDLEGGAGVLQQMLATNDQTGLAMLRSFMSDDDALAESLRRACETGDDGSIRSFTALTIRALRN